MAQGAIAVTGTSRGIGAAIAHELAGRGYTVGCLSRSGDIPAGAEKTGEWYYPFACDVTDESSIAAALENFTRSAGRLDGLINNAGIYEEFSSAALTTAQYEKVMATNATSVMLASREAYPHLCASGGGTIVNIGSFWDKLGVPRNLPYCASKAAVGAMTRCLAVEWARDNIRVINVAPGYIETDINADFFASEKTREWLRQRAPLHRPGTVGEVARLVAALFTEDIGFLTGETIYIDGAQAVAL